MTGLAHNQSDCTSFPQAEVDDCCALTTRPLELDEADNFALLLKILADPTRLRMLSIIAADNCTSVTATKLVHALGITQPTVSHHLKRLTEAGLLERVRSGNALLYKVRPEPFAQLRTLLTMD